MDCPMHCNVLGVAFVSDDLPKRIQTRVNQKMGELEAKMETLRQQVQAEFDEWLDGCGLEQAMGVIIKKNYTDGQENT